MAKIDDLKNKLKKQKALRDKFKKAGKDTLAKKFEVTLAKIEKEIEAEEKKLKDDVKKAEKKVAKKKEPRKPIAGTMSKEECKKLLDDMKKRYLKAESTKKKNIASGKADKSGSLKASASLENEADTIEKKADAGQTLNKKEQKAVSVNIENIVRNCTEMIRTKRDSETMLRDLIRKLQQVLSDVKSGRLKYEG